MNYIMLKFCLTVDCEKFIGFNQENPRWNFIEKIKGKINNFIKKFRYNKNGFYLVYGEIKKQKFPCTFMLVGSLFKPIEKLKFIEYGYHTLNHFPLTLISDEKIEKEVKNIYNAKSITPPLWMVEDIKNPSRVFRILKKQNYQNIVYKGKDDGVKCFHKLDIKKPEKRFEINCVHLSNCFEGHYSQDYINNIKSEILNNLEKDAVYLLSTHDFTHKNIRNLRQIIIFIKKLEEQGKIKNIKLNQAK